MKRITIILLLLTNLVLNGFTQPPGKLSYQTIVRDASNMLVTNQSVGIQISILQGSATGSPKYIETHTPVSDDNGWIELEIGDGNKLSGIFSNIDWTDGPYFIQVETDLTGGIAYTITNTNQIISVPFAFHAATTTNISGGITETDPIFTASVASGITAADTINWNNKLDTEADGSKTNELQTISRSGSTITLSHGGGTFTDSFNVYTAGTDIDITDNIISTTSNVTPPATYQVGEFAQGGIVFWVDETAQHGLVCAKEDQSAGIRWYGGTMGGTNARGSGPLAGETNTIIIIGAFAGIGTDGAPYAARICNELQITEGGKTYGDWYLPSGEELNLMFDNKDIINTTAIANGGSAFEDAEYWSSTELDVGLAFLKNFNNGVLFAFNKTAVFPNVRAVRAF